MKKNAKLLTVFLFTVFLAVTMAVAVSAQSVSTDLLAKVKDHPGYMIDYDGNGVVNEEDAIYLLYHSFMPSAYPITKCENKNCTADVNRDGKSDSDDAIFVLYATFGLQNPCPLEKHAEVKVTGVAATCTTEGMEGGSYCSYCGDFSAAPKVVAPVAHMAVKDTDNCTMCDTVFSDETNHKIVWFELNKNETFYSVCDATASVSGKVEIPAIIDGKPVTKIADSAFFYGHLITEIVVPETVTEIGDQAFAFCSDLVKVTLPKSVETLGKAAFGSCSSLKNITIPTSVSEISENVFYGCTSLENVYFAETSGWYSHTSHNAAGVAVDPAVIADSVAMKNAMTGTSVSYIYRRVIKYSDELVYTLSTDGTYYTVTGIGDCNDVDIKILSVYNDKPVKEISDNAFKDVKSFRSVDIPIGVTYIGKSAFSGCTALVKVDMPDSVTTIGESAFSGCAALTDVKLSTAINEIGAKAFENCTKLVSITVPGGVKKINSGTFFGCSALESATLPDAVSVIGAEAFKNCSKLASVNIPTGLVKLENGVFYGCAALTSVVLPDGVTSIGSEAFRGCAKLTSFAIPSGIKTIESNMFYGCSALKKVTIPSSVTSIGAGTFQNCSALTDITLPVGISSIASNLFNGCKALKTITIPAGVRVIGVKSFSGCSALESISLPAGLEKINSGAFEKCTALKSVTFKMTSGWGYADTSDALEGTLISASILSDAKTAAEALTTTYASKYWTRGEVYSQNLEFTISDDGKYYIVTGIGTCTDMEVTVPSTYKGLPVAEISSFDESV
ncbi:MAG: leucine-rich repeat protein, partial [Clostridia bacterium]|nr:leucine-rich repeat protein [Clostridia bacterium]